MSLEQFVFASRAYDDEGFTAALARRGWRASIVTDRDGDRTIVGWCHAWATPPSDATRRDELDPLQHATVALRLTTPAPEFLARFDAPAPALCYVLHSAANRTPLSRELQYAAWHALGDCTNGLLLEETTSALTRANELPEAAPPSRPAARIAQIGTLAPLLDSFAATRPLVLWFLPIDAETEQLERHGDRLAKHATIEIVEASSRQFLTAYDVQGEKLSVIIDGNDTICDRFVRDDPTRTAFVLLQRLRALSTTAS